MGLRVREVENKSKQEIQFQTSYIIVYDIMCYGSQIIEL